jgi:hypothetical protein
MHKNTDSAMDSASLEVQILNEVEEKGREIRRRKEKEVEEARSGTPLLRLRIGLVSSASVYHH